MGIENILEVTQISKTNLVFGSMPLRFLRIRHEVFYAFTFIIGRLLDIVRCKRKANREWFRWVRVEKGSFGAGWRIDGGGMIGYAGMPICLGGDLAQKSTT